MKKILFPICIFMILTSHACAEHVVSFIIPCYNCDQWIKQAVDSIYQQHLDCPFELVCTDDGSTDQTVAVLNALSAIHPEMRIIQHATNKGGSAARNTCVLNSKGDLIFCLDADNVLVPNTVQLLINRMDATGCDIVSFGGIQFFQDDFKTGDRLTYYTPSQRYTLKDALEHTSTPPWSGNYLFTRKCFDAVGGYPERFSSIDTFAFGFLTLAKHFELTYVPGTYYWHRQGIESYFVREIKSRKLPICFFKLLLEHQQLFFQKTIQILEQQLENAETQLPFLDQAFFLTNKMLPLKN